MAKWLTLTGVGNVLVLGWLLVARVVPAEPANMTVFWVFLGLTLVMGFAYATSQTPGKGKPLAPDVRPKPTVETRDAAG